MEGKIDPAQAQEVLIQCNLSNPASVLDVTRKMLEDALPLIHAKPPANDSLVVLYIQPDENGTPLLSILTKNAEGARWEKGEAAMIPYCSTLTAEEALESFIEVIAGRTIGAMLKICSCQVIGRGSRKLLN